MVVTKSESPVAPLAAERDLGAVGAQGQVVCLGGLGPARIFSGAGDGKEKRAVGEMARRDCVTCAEFPALGPGRNTQLLVTGCV